MNIKWVPVLNALAEREACYETRVGSYRLAAWYECQQDSSNYWRYTCLLCLEAFHKVSYTIRMGEYDEMRAVLVVRSNATIHAIETHAAKHTDELEQQFGADLLDATETAIRMGMESRDAIRDVLKYVPPICNREEQLP